MSVAPPSDPAYDIEFFWDPICPFAWITSRWVEKVAAQTDYAVDWRFISLRLLNRDKDYATDFPSGYEQGHTAGLRMLRVAAAVREDLGRDPLGALVTAYGESYWDKPKGSGMRDHLSTTEHATEVLSAAGLPTSYVDALDDTSWDQMLDDENYGTDPFSLNATASLYAIWEPSGDKHLNPGGEWNQSQIVLKGNRVRHYLNGELMVNGRIGSKDWKQRVAASKFKNRKDFSLNRDGLIMLTEHGNPTWFRNVVITELGPLSGARANR